jgi:hypothetical protein
VFERRGQRGEPATCIDRGAFVDGKDGFVHGVSFG